MTALGVDVGFPIIESSAFRLDLYNDMAILNVSSDAPAEMSEEPLETESLEPLETESTQQKPTTQLESDPIGGEAVPTTEFVWGNAVGIGFALPKASFKFEYRVFQAGYIPSVFDYTYESTKLLSPETDMSDSLDIETNSQQRQGFFSQILWKPVEPLHLFGTFEDYDNSSPKLYMAAVVSELIPRFRVHGILYKNAISAKRTRRVSLMICLISMKSLHSVYGLAMKSIHQLKRLLPANTGSAALKPRKVAPNLNRFIKPHSWWVLKQIFSTIAEKREAPQF